MNRAARPHATRTRRITAGVAAALAAAGATVFTAIWLDDAPTTRAAGVPAPAVVVTPTPPPPTSTPASGVAVAVPHDRVPPAAPHTFSISGPAFSITAHVCSMDATLPLEPPGEQHHTVCWVNQRFGVAPGSDTGTSFILGHAWSRDRLEVLNALSTRATAQLLHAKPRIVDGVKTYPVTALNGYVVTLRTPTGVLRYRVRDAYGVNKYEAHGVRAMWSSTIPHRVVIITCAERNGVDYDDNVVVDAYLISSVRTH